MSDYNMYAYTGWNPVSYVDPWGEKKGKIASRVVALVVTGGVSEILRPKHDALSIGSKIVLTGGVGFAAWAAHTAIFSTPKTTATLILGLIFSGGQSLPFLIPQIPRPFDPIKGFIGGIYRRAHGEEGTDYKKAAADDYGSYCGMNRGTGQNMWKPCVDAIDSACYRHDFCQGGGHGIVSAGGNNAICDQLVGKEVTIVPDADLGFSGRTYKSGVRAVFSGYLSLYSYVRSYIGPFAEGKQTAEGNKSVLSVADSTRQYCCAVKYKKYSWLMRDGSLPSGCSKCSISAEVQQFESECLKVSEETCRKWGMGDYIDRYYQDNPSQRSSSGCK